MTVAEEMAAERARRSAGSGSIAEEMAAERARRTGGSVADEMAAERARRAVDFDLADLQGGYQGEPQTYSQEDKDRIAEWGPTALAAAAGLALPVAPVAAGVGSVLLGTAARGATPLLKGEGWDAALNEMDPRSHPYQVAAEALLPWVGKWISRGSKAKSLADLPDYQMATSLDAPLPSLDEVVTFPETVASDALDPDKLGFLKQARSYFTGPASHLSRQSNAASKVGGQQLNQWMLVRHWLESKGQGVLDDVLGGLTDDELEAVTTALKGGTDDVWKAATSGQRFHPLIGDPRVAEAARRMRAEFYDPFKRKAIESGMRTLDDATGELIDFRGIAENYSPDIPREITGKKVPAADLLRRRFSPAQTEFQRKGGDVEYLTNAREIAQAYLDKMSRKIATSHAFGAPTARGNIGERAEQTLSAIINEGKDLDAAMYGQAIQRIFHPEAATPGERAVDKVAGKLSKLMLGRAALANVRQVANNVMRNGLGRTIEGVSRWDADPAMRELAESSGALRTGFNSWAPDVTATRRTVPMRAMEWVEDKLRGVANAGTVPYVEDLVRRAQAGDKSAALLRQLSELNIPYEEARNGLSADLMRRAFQASSFRNQFFANEIGQNSEFGRSTAGKLMAMFQPYRWQQYRMFRDDVLSPLASGVRNLDASELALGAGRLGRLGGTAAVASAPVTAAYALTAGRDPKPERVVGDWLETVMGPIASVPMALPSLAEGDIGGAFKTVTGGTMSQPPIYSLPEQYARRPEQIPLDALILADPTGIGAALRAPLSAVTSYAIRGR